MNDLSKKEHYLAILICQFLVYVKSEICETVFFMINGNIYVCYVHCMFMDECIALIAFWLKVGTNLH